MHIDFADVTRRLVAIRPAAKIIRGARIIRRFGRKGCYGGEVHGGCTVRVPMHDDQTGYASDQGDRRDHHRFIYGFHELSVAFIGLPSLWVSFSPTVALHASHTCSRSA